MFTNLNKILKSSDWHLFKHKALKLIPKLVFQNGGMDFSKKSIKSNLKF